MALIFSKQTINRRGQAAEEKVKIRWSLHVIKYTELTLQSHGNIL